MLSIEVSLIKITSAFSNSLLLITKVAKLGEPTSSSPSIKNFTFAVNVPVLVIISNAFTCM